MTFGSLLLHSAANSCAGLALKKTRSEARDSHSYLLCVDSESPREELLYSAGGAVFWERGCTREEEEVMALEER